MTWRARLLKTSERAVERLRLGVGSVTFLRGTATVMALRVVGAGTVFLTHIVLARWLGTAEFGVFVYAFAWLTALPVFACLGIDSAVVRLVPEYVARLKWRRLAGVIRRSETAVLLGTMAIAAAGAILVFLFRDRMSAHYVAPMYCAMAGVPLFGLLALYGQLSRGFGWVGAAYGPQFIVRPILLLASVLGAAAIGWTATGTSALSLVLATCLIAVLTARVLFRRRIPSAVVHARPVYHDRHWLRISFPMLLTSGFYVILEYTDILMIGALMEPADVAIYGAAIKIALIAQLIEFAVAALAVPRFAALAAKRDMPAMRAFVGDVANWMFWPTLLVVTALLVSGEWILGLYGEDFVAGYPIFAITLIGYLIWSSTGPVGSYLQMAGYQDTAAIVAGCTAAANLVLNAVLIPRYGLIGAAAATVAAITAEQLCLTLLVWRRLALRSFIVRPR